MKRVTFVLLAAASLAMAAQGASFKSEIALLPGEVWWGGGGGDGQSQRYYRLKFADTYYGEMTHYGLYRLAWADVRRAR